MHNYTIWFNTDLQKTYQLQDGSKRADSPKEALEQYLADFRIISIYKVNSRDNANVSVKFSDGRYNFYNIVIEKVVKDSEKEPDMKTITFNGNQYECKRYSLKELEENFDGYVVVLEDAKLQDMELISGVLVDVITVEQKATVRKQYLLEGKKYTLWDLSPEPVFASYMEIK